MSSDHPDPQQFLLYSAPDGAVKVDVFFRDESVWLTQKAMAELFAVNVPAINKHLKNIFESGELAEPSVISILETTAADGKNYQTRYYNLDAIIAVGYRVNSYQATQFRIWATRTLREFIIKGFVMDDERLKQGKQIFGKDYFDDSNKRHIKELNRIVSAYLDLAENRAERGLVTRMADWALFLDDFLTLSKYPILADAGKISALKAKLKAEGEYAVYRQRQDIEFVSDFDREIKRIEGK